MVYSIPSLVRFEQLQHLIKKDSILKFNNLNLLEIIANLRMKY